MPRAARRPSETNIFHIMLRGIDRQDIFFDDEDRQKYLSILRACKSTCGFQIYAYCLMDNHIHLLMKTGEVPLGDIFKRIGCKFVYWYNLKYQRSGPLFQGRFRSEPVEDDAYFLTVLRYIHQNPVSAGLTAKPESYRWSSYFSYTGWPDGITDVGFAAQMFSDRDALLAYLNEKNDDRVMDVTPARKRGMTDEEAAEIMESICGCSAAPDFQKLNRPMQEACARTAAERGLSLRQLSRLTGITTTTLTRILRREN